MPGQIVDSEIPNIDKSKIAFIVVICTLLGITAGIVTATLEYDSIYVFDDRTYSALILIAFGCIGQLFIAAIDNTKNHLIKIWAAGVLITLIGLVSGLVIFYALWPFDLYWEQLFLIFIYLGLAALTHLVLAVLLWLFSRNWHYIRRTKN